jgi:O-antigen ligase
VQSSDLNHSSKSLRSAWLIAAGVAASLLTGLITGIFGGLVALVALSFIVFMAIAISDYRAGILLAMFLLPLSATSLLPRELFGITGFNPLNATLVMAVTAILFMVLFHRGDIAIPGTPRIFWVYLATLALAAFHGAFHVASIPAYYKTLHIISFDSSAGYIRDIFLKPLLILVTAFMLSIAVRNARRPHVFLIPLFCSAVTLAIAILAYLAVTGASMAELAASESRGTLTAIGMHANELGLMFNMAFALALFCFFSMAGGFGKWMLVLAMIILITAITLTFSRGAYMGFLTIIGYFLYTRKKFSIMLLGMVLVPAAMLIMPQAVVERATIGAQERNMNTITAGRIQRIWLPLLPEVQSSPVIGNGLNSILWSEPAQRGAILRVGHPHSAYLGLLLDLGLLGAVVIFMFYRHMWRLFHLLAKRSSEPIWSGFFHGTLACILVLLVQGLTDDRFTPTFPQTFLWLAYGMALGLMARADAIADSGGATK